MNVYLDTSVLARRLFREAGPTVPWKKIEHAYASRLLRIELARVIDRARLTGRIDDDGVVELHESTAALLRSIDQIEVTPSILDRAALPMPTVVGTLDALHLASAIAVRDALEPDLVFATHDAQLARAARATGFKVIGL